MKRSKLVEKIRFIYGENAVDYRTIERIERGDIEKGRLSTLLQIADALNIDIDELYKGTHFEDRSAQEEAAQGLFITKSSARGDVFRYSDKASLEIVSPSKSGYICFLLKLEPEGKTKLEQDPEGTSKFLYVINGEMVLTVGALQRILKKGDFAEINSHQMHAFENRSGRSATALLYQNPKHY